ncbi:MAG: sensor histidine kinase, partial [bacterium]
YLNWQLSPINTILDKMNKVSKGNMKAKVNIDRDDEIGQLAQKFNEMVDNIDGLLEKVKKDQEEIRKMEFQSLQSQINPHFLYNSLDFINWMTQTEEYDVIEKMVIALSRFFRLSLNKGKAITTIKKEIEHVKNYLVIQELRYPDKFEYEIELDSRIYNNECIKLILQPVVENSLHHGLDELTEGGLIKIKGKKQNDKIHIEVCDNGCGFDVEKMEDYIREKNIKNIEGYGLINVHKRIQLYYGKEYGLSFATGELGGACVSILLPANKKSTS